MVEEVGIHKIEWVDAATVIKQFVSSRAGKHILSESEVLPPNILQINGDDSISASVIKSLLRREFLQCVDSDISPINGFDFKCNNINYVIACPVSDTLKDAIESKIDELDKSINLGNKRFNIVCVAFCSDFCNVLRCFLLYFCRLYNQCHVQMIKDIGQNYVH